MDIVQFKKYPSPSISMRTRGIDGAGPKTKIKRTWRDKQLTLHQRRSRRISRMDRQRRELTAIYRRLLLIAINMVVMTTAIALIIHVAPALKEQLCSVTKQGVFSGAESVQTKSDAESEIARLHYGLKLYEIS